MVTYALGERVAKVLARAGMCSRREGERLINARRVSVNDKIVETPALRVMAGDQLALDGIAVAPVAESRLWLYHKPTGLVTTHKDPQGRPTVFDALPRRLPRVVSVGRLDLNSEGLLLLTNNGELAHHLEHPRFGWVRRYRVLVIGTQPPERLTSLAAGATVDGMRYGPIHATIEQQRANGAWLTIALQEGKNREVRRVLTFIGYRVTRLIRVAYGPFHITTLKRGNVREVAGGVVRDLAAVIDDSGGKP